MHTPSSGIDCLLFDQTLHTHTQPSQSVPLALPFFPMNISTHPPKINNITRTRLGGAEDVFAALVPHGPRVAVLVGSMAVQVAKLCVCVCVCVCVLCVCVCVCCVCVCWGGGSVDEGRENSSQHTYIQK